MEKHEWRKHEKQIYIGKSKPEKITIPKMNYITIEGIGNPNHAEFGTKISALYAISYTIRMSQKNGLVVDGYYPYTVYPLEGFWTSVEQNAQQIAEDGLDKNTLSYKIMVRQPEFVTEDVYNRALAAAQIKDPTNTQIAHTRYEIIDEGNAVQMIHNGSYDTETESFNTIAAYIDSENLTKRMPKYHKEIYLRQDKDDDSRNQTTLRVFVD